MNRIRTKLIASLLAVLIAAALIVVSSFAWLTLSAEPEVGGIKIQIGGSNTIMLAADIVIRNADGTVDHYPGAFSQNLQFGDYATYDYITSLAALSPVSTHDGLHWVRSDFYTDSDVEVQKGTAVSGQLKQYAQLPVDTSLQYANLMEEGSKNGCYAYVDFWVVSPTKNCDLRVSTSNESDTGSFVIGQMNVTANADGTGYMLQEANATAAASVRLGFLVNQETADSGDIEKYLGSAGYSDTYTHLLGRYQEPGESLDPNAALTNRFTIYEPNGNLHADGSSYYQITKPLRVQNGKPAPADISDRLTVQLANHWRRTIDNESTMLEEEFYVSTFGKQQNFQSSSDISRYFYDQHLQGNLAPYVEKGYFVNSTQQLYAEAGVSGYVEENSIALHTADRATDEITIITLEKNVPQRIRMFVWLEGQDADCVNFEDVSGFVINLELAGNEK